MARPKKVKTTITEEVEVQEPIEIEETEGNETPEAFYKVPSTKEEYLALYQCLKDSGINSIGDLEVKASKL